MEEAQESVPFILARDHRTLLKLKEAIVDFTFLSEKPFVGPDAIRDFVRQNCGEGESIPDSPFAAYSGLGHLLKRAGAPVFEWSDLPDFLSSEFYSSSVTPERNIELIFHLKTLRDEESPKEVQDLLLKKTPFLLTHKGALEKPSDIYFPTADDSNWNSPDSEIQFLHPGLQVWLQENQSFREWVESLGVFERTDEAFLKKNILKDPEKYGTVENTLPTILNIFNLYSHHKLDTELFQKLSKLRILTQEGTMRPAASCYFSNAYHPRLPLEGILLEDMYVSEKYLPASADKGEWKRFFKFMGVREGIELIGSEAKTSVAALRQAYGMKEEYFDAPERSFKPLVRTFKPDEYSNLWSLLFIKDTEELPFAKLFWADVIQNLEPFDLIAPATAFWGDEGHRGKLVGTEVQSYLDWFVRHIPSIPTLTGECLPASEVFLNTEEMLELGGSYLPIFNGEQLSPEWRSFFKFRDVMKVGDYLLLLSKIAADTTEQGKLKPENKKRVQEMFGLLLDRCGHWGRAEATLLEEWAGSASLPDTSLELAPCTDLHYFLDGSPAIFLGEFRFLNLSAENSQHPNLERLLSLLQIRLIRQSDLMMVPEGQRQAVTLRKRLKTILPYLGEWIKKSQPEGVEVAPSRLEERVESLTMYEVDRMTVHFGQDWTKSVNVHLDGSVLVVASPWNSNKVFLQLAEKLSSFLGVKGYARQLEFLLRAENQEVREFFTEENISLPDVPEEIEPVPTSSEGQGQDSPQTLPLTEETISSLGIGSLEELARLRQTRDFSQFFHESTPTLEMFQKAMEKIARAKARILAHLNNLPEYTCTDSEDLAPSIIGGIRKGDRDIYIITRPSDNGEVIVYYPAEMDALEYEEAELWYENGVDLPEKMTLGKLLRSTEFNRIPV